MHAICLIDLCTMHEYHSTDAILVKRHSTNRKILLIGALVAIIVGFVIGILIGRFATCPDEKPEERSGAFLPGVDQAIIQDGDPEISDILINGVKSENIRENLRYVQTNILNTI